MYTIDNFKSLLIFENEIYCPIDTDKYSEMLKRRDLLNSHFPYNTQNFVHVCVYPSSFEDIENTQWTCVIVSTYTPEWFIANESYYINKAIETVKNLVPKFIATGQDYIEDQILIVRNGDNVKAANCSIIYLGGSLCAAGCDIYGRVTSGAGAIELVGDNTLDLVSEDCQLKVTSYVNDSINVFSCPQADLYVSGRTYAVVSKVKNLKVSGHAVVDLMSCHLNSLEILGNGSVWAYSIPAFTQLTIKDAGILITNEVVITRLKKLSPQYVINRHRENN